MGLSHIESHFLDLESGNTMLLSAWPPSDPKPNKGDLSETKN
jgi:hypothetical protein